MHDKFLKEISKEFREKKVLEIVVCEALYNPLKNRHSL